MELEVLRWKVSKEKANIHAVAKVGGDVTLAVFHLANWEINRWQVMIDWPPLSQKTIVRVTSLKEAQQQAVKCLIDLLDIVEARETEGNQ